MSQFNLTPVGPPRGDSMALLAQLASQLMAGRDRHLLSGAEAMGSGLQNLGAQKMQASELVAKLRAAQQQQQSEQMSRMLQSGMANATSLYEGAQDRKSREKIAKEQAEAYRSKTSERSEREPNIMEVEDETMLNAPGRIMLNSFRSEKGNEKTTLADAQSAIAANKWPKVRSEAGDEPDDPVGAATGASLSSTLNDLMVGKITPEQAKTSATTALATATRAGAVMDEEDLENAKKVARAVGLSEDEITKALTPVPSQPAGEPKKQNIIDTIKKIPMPAPLSDMLELYRGAGRATPEQQQQSSANAFGQYPASGFDRQNETGDILSRLRQSSPGAFMPGPGPGTIDPRTGAPWSPVPPLLPGIGGGIGAESVHRLPGASDYSAWQRMLSGERRSPMFGAEIGRPGAQPGGDQFMQSLQQQPNDEQRARLLMQMLGLL